MVPKVAEKGRAQIIAATKIGFNTRKLKSTFVIAVIPRISKTESVGISCSPFRLSGSLRNSACQSSQRGSAGACPAFAQFGLSEIVVFRPLIPIGCSNTYSANSTLCILVGVTVFIQQSLTARLFWNLSHRRLLSGD